MKRIAVFPGSFDPITKGHESIIRRAIPLFDKIIVAIGVNAEKSGFFSVEKRKQWLEIVFENDTTVSVDVYSGLTVEYCKANGINYILRGLRTSADFEFERSIGQVNKKLYPSIETVFLLTTPELTALNSSIVRDIIRHGGDPSPFVPDGVDCKE
jgi:pantetheine-phosphate adenylyltransferase